MPNTLVHIALQTPPSRKIFPKAPIPWIILGTIIPDIPWILQRVALTTHLIDPYSLRLYVTAQASFFFSMLLCLTFAGLSKTPKKVFLILAINTFFHLLLDAMQSKWGNGVHFFAPFSWHITSLNLFWPENIFILPLSAAGVILLVILLPKIHKEPLQLHLNWKLLVPPLLVYLLMPILFFPSLRESNPSYLATLQDGANRSGKYIELDRNHYDHANHTISFFTHEKVIIIGNLPERSGTVSIRGHFISPQIISASQYHFHTANRDIIAIIGLAMALLIWTYSIFLHFNLLKNGKQP